MRLLLSAMLLASAANAAAQTPAAKPAPATRSAPAAKPVQPAQPDPAEMGLRQYGEMSRMQMIDDRCHWLDATSRVALDASVAERRAWLQDKAPAALGKPGLLDPEKARARAVSCGNGKNSNGETQAIRFAAWQMRMTWTLRAYALLDDGARPAWFARQSPTLPYRKALEDTVAAARAAKYGESVGKALPGIETEAAQMLSKACPKQPQQCPLKGAPTDASKAYAETWVRQASLYATALAKATVKLPPAPTANN